MYSSTIRVWVPHPGDNLSNPKHFELSRGPYPIISPKHPAWGWHLAAAGSRASRTREARDLTSKMSYPPLHSARGKIDESSTISQAGQETTFAFPSRYDPFRGRRRVSPCWPARQQPPHCDRGSLILLPLFVCVTLACGDSVTCTATEGTE